LIDVAVFRWVQRSASHSRIATEAVIDTEAGNMTLKENIL
jgi:hypothetical protein